jgi:endonuclease/exonuclease/phosphatase family metal-dependent hydrolase
MNRLLNQILCTACIATIADLSACGGNRLPGPSSSPVTTDTPAASTTRATSLTVVTLNIWHNQEDWPARLDYMVGTLSELEPDVICLQEVLQNPELPNQAETIADRLGYRYYFVSVDTPGSAKRYGNAILTRHPVLAETFRRLEPLNDYRTAAHVRIRVGTDSIDVYNSHLHYSAQGGGTVRRTQLLDLLDFVEATRAHGPVILAGDFNAPVTEPELRTLDGLFVDTYGLLHADPEAVSTLNPAKGHREVRIDHIFYRHGPARALRPVTVELILDRPTARGLWASDHFGLMARFEAVGW